MISEIKIIKLVDLLKSIGTHLKRFTLNGYISYSITEGPISIAICNFHSLKCLNETICVTLQGYQWEDGIIILPIPDNDYQRNFVIEKIEQLKKESDNFEKITDYDISAYNLR